ncbi:LOW QUALITY PROTEIN: proto-oncogene DBL [Molossus nigricans]
MGDSAGVLPFGYLSLSSTSPAWPPPILLEAILWSVCTPWRSCFRGGGGRKHSIGAPHSEQVPGIQELSALQTPAPLAPQAVSGGRAGHGWAERVQQQEPSGGAWTPTQCGVRQRTAGTIILQVDMAMALQCVKLAENCGKSYLCLLQMVFLADSDLRLCVKDISHFLMQDIAFLSGGRGKGAWVITFPENCNFRYIPEEVIAKVLRYLTSIARQNGSDSRFTIILDQRLATWSSFKICLQIISASFPGNLHLVLVLCPITFLQRTFTDIGFQFRQEDFMLKLPVVMLSSVVDLLTYIDDKHLTPELGGTLQYCHSEWIIFRNAIENFALTVKEMAQMLQSFGIELAETELPDDISSIEEILVICTERYHLLKNDITAITKEGKLLLTNLEVPDTKESVSTRLEHHQQISGDWQTVNKLLTQVHDMKIAFDEFWEKHQLKMEQYLQLWKFEQDFQKDLLAKAQFVILHGHRLAANHHYALDLICQRYNELRLSNMLVNEIKAKRMQLSRIFKMHKLLLQARQYCDEEECLLDNQEIDRFQSKKDAQKALQDIEHFLEMAQPFINYDNKTLQYEFDVILSPEIKIQMHTVQLKLESIRSIFENQQAVFKNLKGEHVRPIQFTVPVSNKAIRSKASFFPPKPARVVIWYRMMQISIKYSSLAMSVSIYTSITFTLFFSKWRKKADFQMYEKYCLNKPRSEAICKKYSECAFFQECQRKLKHRLGLDSYLLKPMQRLTKYQLLLKLLICAYYCLILYFQLWELLKYSKGCEGYEQLKEALDTMLDILKSVNDSMHQIAINGYIGNLNELGKMIMQGAFSVWIGQKRGATKMKDFDRLKSMQWHLFLYEKAIVFCKRHAESGEGSGRYPSYSFKCSLKVRHFELSSNIDVKIIWLKEMRSILKQKELMTGKFKHAFFQNKSQQGALIGAEEIESEHTSTVLGVREAITAVQAEANTADFRKRSSKALLIINGDVIQLLHEDAEGQWLVKNLNRRKEGLIPGNSLQILIGDYRFWNVKVTGIV